MFEMLTGQLPFNAPTAAEFARMHRQDLPPSPRSLNPDIPPEIDQILLKTLAKEPAARYRTAGQLGRVLKSYHKDSISTVAPQSRPAPLVVSGTTETQPYEAPQAPEVLPQKSDPWDLDWVTIGLAFLALLAVGGLIPFFLWVYFVFNPPIR
jgi:serine/threonine-protein kinase